MAQPKIPHVELKLCSTLSAIPERILVFPSSDKVENVLLQARSDLEIQADVLLVKAKDKAEYIIANPNETLEELGVVDKEAVVVPICKNRNMKLVAEPEPGVTKVKTVSLDLTVRIRDILTKDLAKKLFPCQVEQYALYAQRGDQLQPLDWSLPIAVQIDSNTEELNFRRRFFLVDEDELKESKETCQHIFRDFKCHYLTHSFHCSDDQAKELARLLVLSESSTYEAAVKIVEGLKGAKKGDRTWQNYFSKNAKLSRKVQERLKKEVCDKTKFESQEEAMIRFVQKVVNVKDFGCERFEASRKIDGKRIELDFVVGPHGVVIEEKGKVVMSFDFIETEYLCANRRLWIRYNDPKTKEKVKLAFRIPNALNAAWSLINGYNDLGKCISDRVKPVSEESAKEDPFSKQYKSFLGAEMAMDTLCDGVKRESQEPDFARYGLQIVTTAEECTEGDRNWTDLEIEDLQEILKNIEDLTESEPIAVLNSLTSKVFEANVMLLNNKLIEVRGHAHELSQVAAEFAFDCAIQFLDVMTKPYCNEPLMEDAEKIRTHLVNLLSRSKAGGGGDFVQKVVDEINQGIEPLSSLKEKAKLLVAANANQKSSDVSAKRPTGVTTLLAVIKCMNDLVQLLFDNSATLFSTCGFDCRKSITALAETSERGRLFVSDLVSGNCANQKEAFRNMTEVFATVNDFLMNQRIHHASSLKNKFTNTNRLLIELFEELEFCFLEDDELIRSRLFPGSVSGSEDFLASLDSISANVDKLKDLRQVIIDHCEKLQENPSDEYTRIDLIQTIHEAKNTLRTEPSEKQDEFEKFVKQANFFICQLSPDNISPLLVEVCTESLTSLAHFMNRYNFNEADIGCVRNFCGRLEKLNVSLKGNPIDGAALEPTCEALWNICGGLRKMSEAIPRLQSQGQQDDAVSNLTVGIELLITFFERALGNPYIDDDFESCEHLKAFAQAQHDLARVIGLLNRLLRLPHALRHSEMNGSLNRSLATLQELYVELTVKRYALMRNAFMSSIVSQVLVIFSRVVMTEVSMISDVQRLDYLNQNDVMKQMLCISMLSIRKFYTLIKDNNIGPYDNPPSVATIKKLHESLSTFVEILSKIELFEPLKRELDVWKDMLCDVEKAKDDESCQDKFVLLLLSISEHINAFFSQYGAVPELQSQDIKKAADEILALSSPYVKEEKFDNLKLKDVLKAARKKVKKLKPQKGTEARDLVEFLRGTVKEADNLEKMIPLIKERVLHVEKSLSDSASGSRERDARLALLTALKYMRQIPVVVNVSVAWEKPVVTEFLKEIDERARCIIEQLQVLTDAFQQTSETSFVKDNPGLAEVIEEFKLFFASERDVIANADDLEGKIEPFCREIAPKISEIEMQLKFLSHIFADHSLIDAVVTFNRSVLKVIKRFDGHCLTTARVRVFGEVVMPEFEKVTNDVQVAVDAVQGTVEHKNAFHENLKIVLDEMKVFPKSVSSMKPSEVQKRINAFLASMSSVIPNCQDLLSMSELSVPLIDLYNKLVEYASRDEDRPALWYSSGLRVEVAESRARSFVLKEFQDIAQHIRSRRYDAVVDLSLSEKVTENMDRLEEKGVPAHINFARKVWSAHLLKPTVPVVLGCMTVLAALEPNTEDLMEEMQIVVLESAWKASEVLASVREVLDETSANGIVQEQLRNLIQQICTTIEKRPESLAVMWLTYVPMWRVLWLLISYSVLANSELLNALCDSYLGFFFQLSLALSEMVMIHMDQIVLELEKIEKYRSFAVEAAKLLLNPRRMLLFDSPKLAKLAALFLEFECTSLSEIEAEAATNDAMKCVKQHMNHISEFKPLLSLWRGAIFSTCSGSFVDLFQSVIEHLRTRLEMSLRSIKVDAISFPVQCFISASLASLTRSLCRQHAAQPEHIQELEFYLEEMKVVAHVFVREILSYKLYVTEMGAKLRAQIERSLSKVQSSLETISKKLESQAGTSTSPTPEDQEPVSPRNEEDVQTTSDDDKSELAKKMLEAIELRIPARVTAIWSDLGARLAKEDPRVADLRSIYEDGRIFKMRERVSEFSKCEKKVKETLVQLVMGWTEWQDSTLDTVTDAASARALFSTLKNRFSETVKEFVTAKDKTISSEKLVQIAADTQALVVHSFRFKDIQKSDTVSSDVYCDLLKTTCSLWNVMSKVLFPKQEKTSQTRLLNSAQRLVTYMSGIFEDTSLPSGDVEQSQGDRARNRLLRLIMELCRDIAASLSVFVIAHWSPSLYECVRRPLNATIEKHQKLLIDEINVVLSFGIAQEDIDSVVAKRREVLGALINFVGLPVEKPKETERREPDRRLELLVTESQRVYTSMIELSEACKELVNLDVVRADLFSAKELEKVIKELGIPPKHRVDEGLLMQHNALFEDVKTCVEQLKERLQKNLMSNREIVKAVEYLRQAVKDYMKCAMSAREVTFVLRNDIFLRCDALRNSVNDFVKIMRYKCLGMSDWNDQADKALERIMSVIDGLYHTIRETKPAKFEWDTNLTSLKDSSAKIADRQVAIGTFIRKLSKAADSPQKEVSLSLCRFMRETTEAVIRLLVCVLSDEQRRELAKPLVEVTLFAKDFDNKLDEFMIRTATARSSQEYDKLGLDNLNLLLPLLGSAKVLLCQESEEARAIVESMVTLEDKVRKSIEEITTRMDLNNNLRSSMEGHTAPPEHLVRLLDLESSVLATTARLQANTNS